MKKQSESGKIAIVGASCRLPRSVEDVNSFWKFLCESGCGSQEIPLKRWNNVFYFNEDQDMLGKSSVKNVHIVDEVSKFDNVLFSLNAKEATCMDPQQRILLEEVFRGLENAGIPLKKAKGTRTGVYVGVMNQDYSYMQDDFHTAITTFSSTGLAYSIMSNRISYTFDFRGPSMTIDTACSSTLVCLDNAIKSLLEKDTNMSVVAGINVLLIPRVFVALTKLRILSMDGLSKAFDEKADGYARGEGCGVLILKRLEDAQRDGDRIYGVLLGTKINSDGRSAKPMTQPSVIMQKRLFKECLEKSNISDPSVVQYIEAHGTGTVRGDGIECASISDVYSCQNEKIRVGSVKTNVGHLEAAAGVIGVLKTILCLYHKKFVPSLFFNKFPDRLEEKIKKVIKVQTEIEDWPSNKNKLPRIAAVNSFGYGGTNGQAICMEYVENRNIEETQNEPTNEIFILTVSSHHKKSQKEYIQRNIDFLKNSHSNSLNDLRNYCYTSTVRKNHLLYRNSVCGRDKNEIIKELQSRIFNVEKSINKKKENSIVFLFPGQGCQTRNMGKDLLKLEPFEREFKRINTEIQKKYKLNVLECVLDQKKEMDLVLTNLLIFSYQSSIFKCLKEYGIKGNVFCGYSLGEVSLAYVTKKISLSKAIDVIVIIASEVKSNIENRKSRMAVVWGEESIVEKVLKVCEVEIACRNSNNCFTFAGDIENMKKAMLELQMKKYQPTYLEDVDYAFHTKEMEKVKEKVISKLTKVFKTKEPVIKDGIRAFSSTVGKETISNEYDNPEFWWKNMRNVVNFKKVLDDIIECKLKNTVFYELSPKSVMGLFVKADSGNSNYQILCSGTSPKKSESERINFMEGICKMYHLGEEIDFDKIYKGNGKFVETPKMPFVQQVFWNESLNSFRARMTGPEDISFPNSICCGMKRKIYYDDKNMDDLLKLAIYEWEYVPEENGIFMDHVFGGNSLIPGTFYLETFLSVAENICPMKIVPFELKDVKFIKACWFDNTKLKNKLRVTVKAINELCFQCEIHNSQQEGNNKGKTTLHASCIIEYVTKAEEKPLLELDSFKVSKTYSHSKWYDEFKDSGFSYGERFTLCSGVEYEKGRSIATVSIKKMIHDEIEKLGFFFHPGVIDAGSQGIAADESEITSSLPVSIKKVVVFDRVKKENREIKCMTKNIVHGSEIESGDCHFYDSDSKKILFSLYGFQCKTMESNLRPKLSFIDKIYSFRWEKEDMKKMDKEIIKKRSSVLISGYKIKENIKKILQENYGVKVVEVLNTPKDLDNIIFSIIGNMKKADVIVTPLQSWISCKNEEDFFPKVMELSTWYLAIVKSLIKVMQKNPDSISTFHTLTKNLYNPKMKERKNKGLSEMVQSVLVGYFRVLRTEIRQLEQSKIIDADFDFNDGSEQNLNNLLCEILEKNDVDQICFKDEQKFLYSIFNYAQPEKKIPFIKSNATYVIGGGNGDVGVLLTKHFIENGAKSIVLVSRSGKINEKNVEILNKLKTDFKDAKVLIVKSDLTDPKCVDTILENTKNLPPLRGLFNLCMVLRDQVIENVEVEKMKTVLSSKILTTLHLKQFAEKSIIIEEELTQKRADIDFFVVFSSTTSFWGNEGQFSYGGGNSFLDLIAHNCSELHKLPIIAVNWPPLGEVGVLERKESLRKKLEKIGYDLIGRKDIVRYVEHFIAQLSNAKSIQKENNYGILSISPPVFYQNAKYLLGKREFKNAMDKWERLFFNSTTESSVEVPVDSMSIIKTIGDILGIDLDIKDLNVELVSLGLDSIYAVDLRNYLSMLYGVDIQIAELLNSETKLESIVKKIQSNKKKIKEDEKKNVEPTTTKEIPKKIKKEIKQKIDPEKNKEKEVIKPEVHYETQKVIIPISGKSNEELKQKIDKFYQTFSSDKLKILSKFEYIFNTLSEKSEYNNHGFRKSLEITLKQILDGVEKKEGKEVNESVVEPIVVFAFSGQGQQVLGMARELVSCNSRFRRYFQSCLELVDNLHQKLGITEDVSLRGMLLNENESSMMKHIDRTDISQLMIFIVEYSIAKTLIDYGIKPTVTMGHSIGEIVSSCIGGVFSLMDALLLVIQRGRFMRNTPPGKMLAVRVGLKEISKLLEEFNKKNNFTVQIALVNTETQVVVAGKNKEIDALIVNLSGHGMKCTLLRNKHAFHTNFMSSAAKDLKKVIDGMKIKKGKINVPFYSNVTGELLLDAKDINGDYFVNHMCGTVFFSQNVLNLKSFIEGKPAYILELGPGDVLKKLISRHRLINQSNQKTTKVMSMFPNKKYKVNEMMAETSNMWEFGLNINFDLFNKDFSVLPPKTELKRLSFAQERIWMIEQFEESSKYHHTETRLYKKDEIPSIDDLKRVLRTVVQRHEILRSKIVVNEKGVPYHDVLDKSEVEISIDINTEFKKTSFHTMTELEHEKLMNILIDYTKKPFNFKNPPIFRVMYIEMENELLLHIVFHHIILDGFTLAQFGKEVRDILMNEKLPNTSEISFFDISLHERMKMKVDKINKSKIDFWKKEFSSTDYYIIPPINLTKEKKGLNHVGINLNAKQIMKLSKSLKITVASFMQTVLVSFLNQLSIYEKPISFGLVELNRPPANEYIFGTYINILPVRLEINEEENIFKELAKKVHNHLFKIRKESIPFDVILQELKVARNKDKNNLFQVLFNFRTFGFNTKEEEGLKEKGNEDQKRRLLSADTLRESQFDMEVMIDFDSRQEICDAKIIFDDEQYDHSFIEFFAKSLEYIVNQVEETKGKIDIKDLDLMDEKYRRDIVMKMNDFPEISKKSRGWKNEPSMWKLFMESVKKFGKKEAVFCEVDGKITYDELFLNAICVSETIKKKGVKKNDIVGVYCDRNVVLPGILLGIIRSGAAYLPLDPDYCPKDYLHHIIQGSKIKFIITKENMQKNIQNMINEYTGENKPEILIYEKIEFETIKKNLSEKEKNEVIMENCRAYVEYTSGSTGKPKGVIITHRNVISLLDDCAEDFHFTPDSKCLMFHSFSFDLHAYETWGTLLTGGTLYNIKAPNDIELIYNLCNKYSLSHISFTPTVFRSFVRENLKRLPNKLEKLEMIMLCGEILPFATFVDWYKVYSDRQPIVINSYGITETTVVSTYKKMKLGDEKLRSSFIGGPLKNNKFAILNKNKKLLPPGIEGEMFISGECLSPGYLSKTKTDEKFTDGKKIFGEKFEKMYQTGDLCKFVGNDYEFLGRLDNQLAIFGYRIESEHVESVILSLPQNVDVLKKICVAPVMSRLSGNPILTAFCELSDNTKEVSKTSILQGLSEKIPKFMVPKNVIFCVIPLTRNKKINRTKLIGDYNSGELNKKQKVPSKSKEEIEKTENEDPIVDYVEFQVKEAFKSVFGDIFSQGMTNSGNFFVDYGGSSLQAIQIIHALNKRMGLILNTNVLYLKSSIDELTDYIRTESEKKIKEFLLIKLNDNLKKDESVVSSQNEDEDEKDQIIFGESEFDKLRVHDELSSSVVSKKRICLIMLSPAGGGSIQYTNLARDITLGLYDQSHVEIEIYGLEETRASESDTFDYVISNYAKEIVTNIVLPNNHDKNFHLVVCGYSLGGTVSYALSEHLFSHYNIISSCIIIDSFCNDDREYKSHQILWALSRYYNRIINRSYKRLNDRKKRECSVEDDWKDLPEEEIYDKYSEGFKIRPFDSKEWLKDYVKRFLRDLNVWKDYHPQKKEKRNNLEGGDVYYIGCEENMKWNKEWEDITKNGFLGNFYGGRSVKASHEEIIGHESTIESLKEIIMDIVSKDFLTVEPEEDIENEGEKMKYLKQLVLGYETAKFNYSEIANLSFATEKIYAFSNYVFRDLLFVGDKFLLGKKILSIDDNLDTGNPCFPCPDSFSNEISKFGRNDMRKYDMDLFKEDSLVVIRNRLIKFYEYIKLLPTESEGFIDLEVTLGSGTSHLNDCCVRCFVRRNDDVVLVPSVTYGFLLPSVELERGKVKFIHPDKKIDYKISAKTLEEIIINENERLFSIWIFDFYWQVCKFLRGNGIDYKKYDDYIKKLEKEIIQYKSNPVLIDQVLQKKLLYVLQEENKLELKGEDGNVAMIPTCPRCVAFLFINPTPFGQFYSVDEIEQLGRVLNKYRVNIIEDLAYVMLFLNKNKYLESSNTVSFLKYRNSICLNIKVGSLFGLSKPFGISNIRVGVMIGSNETVREVDRYILASITQVPRMVKNALKNMLNTRFDKIVKRLERNSFNESDGYCTRKDVLMMLIQGDKFKGTDENHRNRLKGIIKTSVIKLFTKLKNLKISVISDTVKNDPHGDNIVEKIVMTGMREWFEVMIEPDAGFFIIIDCQKLIDSDVFKSIGMNIGTSLDVCTLLYYMYGIRVIPEEVIGPVYKTRPNCCIRVSFSVEFDTIVWSMILTYIGLEKLKKLSQLEGKKE